LQTDKNLYMCVCVCVQSEFVIERLAEHGGDVTFADYQQLETAFADKVST